MGCMPADDTSGVCIYFMMTVGQIHCGAQLPLQSWALEITRNATR